MTANQIAYASFLENKRSNVTREIETERNNRANVGLGYSNLGELTRSNLVRESQNLKAIDEQMRHNISTESLGWDTLSNQQQLTELRSKEVDVSQEQSTIRAGELDERIRSNKAQEELKQRETNLRTTTNVTDTFMRSFPMWYNILNPKGVLK